MDILQRRALAFHALKCYNEARDRKIGGVEFDAVDLITDLFILVRKEKNILPPVLIQTALHKFNNLSLKEI